MKNFALLATLAATTFAIALQTSAQIEQCTVHNCTPLNDTDGSDINATTCAAQTDLCVCWAPGAS